MEQIKHMRHQHHHRADYHHSRIHRRDARRAGIAAALLLIVLAAAAFLIGRWEDQTFASSAGSYTYGDHPEAITYNGILYSPKERVEAYLLMGIDVTGPVVSTPGAYNGGQADALFLVVLDNEAQTWRMLRLNRDSMVDVPVLDLRGDAIGTERQQLALAHAYGDGTQVSCMNTVDAVSDLLGDWPIDGYASLNMDGIAILNDAVGGVTLTVTSDFTAVDPTLAEGETITLNGEQAMEFVRTRKDVDDQSNLARMERQRQYLEAMKPQLLTLGDEEILQVYERLGEYVVTNISSQNVLTLAEKMQEYQELPELTIDGENTLEDGHIAYILDQDSVQRTVLELFYQEN